MIINSKDFCVKEADEGDLGKWPTKLEPVYKSIHKAARSSASNIQVVPNCNTIFSGAPLVIYRSAGGSASSSDPITRRC